MNVKNVENFVGNKINYLTIIKNDNADGKITVQCDCGTIKDVYPGSLLQKRLFSCGCKRKELQLSHSIEKNKVHIGKIFNRLLIKDIVEEDGILKFQCFCQCGNKLNYMMSAVINGKKGSCGCLEKDNFKLQGERLGNYNKTHGTFRNYKYNYNLTFFNKLTPDSAYILGLLYSDGNMHKDKNQFSIGLQEKDKSILQKISILLCNEDKLTKVTNNTAFEYKCQDIYRLIINQKEMYQDLLSWGLYPNKSLTLSPDERLLLNRDFWRGCIDGDGTLSFDKNGRFTLGFVGSEQMVTSFKKYCEYVLNDNIISVIEKKENIFCFRIDGIKGRLIVENLYTDCNLFIERKYTRYLEYFPDQSPKTYRKKIMIEYKGKTQTLKEWCEELNLGKNSTLSRYHKGCTVEELFEHPYNVKGFKSILHK